MSMTEFVRRAEQRSKDSINRCYESINFLYYELDFLNDLLLRYSNRVSGKSMSTREKLNREAEMRERIPRVYEDINYYKECINCERKEMKRIHDTYGYPSGSNEYQSSKYINNTEDEEDDEEYIHDYKYNFATDTWE